VKEFYITGKTANGGKPMFYICHLLHEILISLMLMFSGEELGEVHPHCSMVLFLGLMSQLKVGF